MTQSSHHMHIYPAIFDYADDGINVSFPDLPGCLTCADTTKGACAMAQEALTGYLMASLDHGYTIAPPTDADKITVGPNQKVIIFSVDLAAERLSDRNKAVKKTLTIPGWLDDLAKANHINYSSVLQEALKAKLCP